MQCGQVFSLFGSSLVIIWAHPCIQYHRKNKFVVVLTLFWNCKICKYSFFDRFQQLLFKLIIFMLIFVFGGNHSNWWSQFSKLAFSKKKTVGHLLQVKMKNNFFEIKIGVMCQQKVQKQEFCDSVLQNSLLHQFHILT